MEVWSCLWRSLCVLEEGIFSCVFAGSDGAALASADVGKGTTSTEVITEQEVDVSLCLCFVDVLCLAIFCHIYFLFLKNSAVVLHGTDNRGECGEIESDVIDKGCNASDFQSEVGLIFNL